MTGISCVGCIHFRPNEEGNVCDAFPEGIPEKIIVGFESHREPIEHDNDIQWEPKPGLGWME